MNSQPTQLGSKEYQKKLHLKYMDSGKTNKAINLWTTSAIILFLFFPFDLGSFLVAHFHHMDWAIELGSQFHLMNTHIFIPTETVAAMVPTINQKCSKETAVVCWNFSW